MRRWFFMIMIRKLQSVFAQELKGRRRTIHSYEPVFLLVAFDKNDAYDTYIVFWQSNLNMV